MLLGRTDLGCLLSCSGRDLNQVGLHRFAQIGRAGNASADAGVASTIIFHDGMMLHPRSGLSPEAVEMDMSSK